MTDVATKKHLTIIIPGYNEEDKIAISIDEAFAAASEHLDEFEIIAVDDGSSDRTYAAARNAADRLGGRVRVVRQETNQGVGAAYVRGLSEAAYPYITLIPGDNAFGIRGVQRLLSMVGSSELIISYRANPAARTPVRRVLSKLATRLLRVASGKRIRDAHGMFVFPVKLAREIDVSPGYSYHLESLCRLLCRVDSFKEVPVDLNPKPDASSGVMRPKTVLKLGWAMARMLALRATGRLR
jgi:glycosyltransferase involved in cell wall biosynthesis